jgi:hypothetical protein
MVDVVGSEKFVCLVQIPLDKELFLHTAHDGPVLFRRGAIGHVEPPYGQLQSTPCLPVRDREMGLSREDDSVVVRVRAECLADVSDQGRADVIPQRPDRPG